MTELKLKPIPWACLAPPLSDEILARYRQLAGAAPGPLRDAMLACLVAVSAWWELPESTLEGEKYKIGTRNAAKEEKIKSVEVRPLEDGHKATLDDLIPWEHEIFGIQRLFDAIPESQKELRDAAFHLLWYLKEIDCGREPVTAEALK